MEQYMWIIWTAFLVISLIVEVSTAALVSIWFAVGAGIALILSFIPGIPYWVEIIVFLGASLVTFLAIRPFLTKLMKKRIVRSNVDTLIGKKGVVTGDIEELNPGSVSLNGITWTAVSADGVTIPKGEIVIIKALEGNKLVVVATGKE